MKIETRDYDVVVVGAGTAGSAAAYQLARRGLRVIVLEARALDSAGPRWINAIPPWLFDRADVARPDPPELTNANPPAVTLTESGCKQVRIDPGPAWFVDIRSLVQRLQGLAQDAGAELLEYVQLRELDLQGGRPTALTVICEPTSVPPRRLKLRARLFVDASGRSGALRRMVHELDRHCPPVGGAHTCLAMQELRSIDEPDGARAFVDRYQGTPGDMLNFLSVDGGWSTVAVTVSPDLTHVDLLGGSIGDGRHAPGAQLLRDFRSRETWIGGRRFGGGAPIPLRRPYDRLAAPGIVLVGDAGCQVFSAHGSGTGAGMVAGRMLAEAVDGRADPGSLEATWAYQVAFQREFGAVHAAYDIFRRMTQATPEEDVKTLFDSGLITVSSTVAGMEMHMPRATPGELVQMVGGVLREPRLAAGFGAGMAKMLPVYGLYRTYPRTPDLARLRRWSHRVAGIFGEPPDIP